MAAQFGDAGGEGRDDPGECGGRDQVGEGFALAALAVEVAAVADGRGDVAQRDAKGGRERLGRGAQGLGAVDVLVGVEVGRRAADETDDRGRPVRGDTMLLLINGGFDPVTYVLPKVAGEGKWRLIVDTAGGTHGRWEKEKIALPGFSLSLLRHGVERRASWMGGEYASQLADDVVRPTPPIARAESTENVTDDVSAAVAGDVTDAAAAKPMAEPTPPAPPVPTRTAV